MFVKHVLSPWHIFFLVLYNIGILSDFGFQMIPSIVEYTNI